MTTIRTVATATTANPNLRDLYLDASGQVEIIGDLAARAATFGTVTCQINLNAGATAPAQSVVSVGGSPSRWVLQNATTNGGGAPASFNVYCVCQRPGPIEAAAGAIDTIDTPAVGWNSVTNAVAAVPGTEAEAVGVSFNRALAQRIRSRLLFFRGEWYLDQRQGTPWFERVFAKGVTEGEVRAVVRQVVETTPGVRRFVSCEVTIDRQTRQLAVTDLVIESNQNTTLTAEDFDLPFLIEVRRG